MRYLRNILTGLHRLWNDKFGLLNIVTDTNKHSVHNYSERRYNCQFLTSSLRAANLDTYGAWCNIHL
jgi:hypothetical protein